MAPEILSNKNTNATPAIDVWSIGCILHTMLTGKPPSKWEKNPMVGISKPCKGFLKWLLEPDPVKRISITECFNHSWILNPPIAIETTKSQGQPSDDSIADSLEEFETRSVNQSPGWKKQVINNLNIMNPQGPVFVIRSGHKWKNSRSILPWLGNWWYIPKNESIGGTPAHQRMSAKHDW